MTSLLNYFSYETVKYVKVEDPRLGCLRILLLLLIVAYVGIVEMAYMGGYLEATRVVGAVRFSLEQPRIGCDGMDSDQENCTNAFAPLDTLPYCKQSIKVQEDLLVMNAEEMEITSTSRALRSNDYMGLVYPCQIYEAVNAQLMRESSMVVWTRASTKNQSLICDGTQENTCPQTYESHGNQEPFYIAQSEAFTMLLEHAATASHICETKSQHYSHYSCSAQPANYPQSGRLLSLSHGLCQQAHANGQRAYAEPLKEEHVSHAPCYIAPNRTSNNHDFFSLDVLLKAAGIASLDDCLTTTNATSCTTVRESGATILLTVLWNDFLPYRGIVEPYYHYKARIIGTDYKETHAFYNSIYDLNCTLQQNARIGWPHHCPLCGARVDSCGGRAGNTN